MGYDLRNQLGEDFRWTQTFWGRVLALAEKYGWKAKGTTLPKEIEPEWDGNYWYNSGQTVESEDAILLADALEKSLPFLPKEEVKIPQPKFETDPETKLPHITNWDSFSLEDFFSGENGRKSIESFIAFCRKGSFQIK